MVQCRGEESYDVREPLLDPEEFLERLKAEHQILRWEPLPPDSARSARDSNQVRSKSSLEYLHHHWVLPDSFDPADAGVGIRGRIVGIFGRLTFRVLSRYLGAERNLLAHVVQVNEALERRCDELTLRCHQLNDDMVSRQVAEARNQAKLAVWLHLDPPQATPSAHQGTNAVDAGDTSSGR
jgi:hypothetical protein